MGRTAAVIMSFSVRPVSTLLRWFAAFLSRYQQHDKTRQFMIESHRKIDLIHCHNLGIESVLWKMSARRNSCF
jgi:hypothetical protein